MSIIWICAGTLALALLLFILWSKEKPRNIYPRLTTVIGVLGIIAIPFVMIYGQYYNDTQMVNSIETNYGVEVVSHDNDKFLISVNSDIHSCSINIWQDESYYVLCDVPNGRLLLNEVADSKE